MYTKALRLGRVERGSIASWNGLEPGEGDEEAGVLGGGEVLSGAFRKWNRVRRALASLNMGLWEVGSCFGSTPAQDTHMAKSSGKHRRAGKEPDSLSLFRQHVFTSTCKVQARQ